MMVFVRRPARSRQPRKSAADFQPCFRRNHSGQTRKGEIPAM